MKAKLFKINQSETPYYLFVEWFSKYLCIHYVQIID